MSFCYASLVFNALPIAPPDCRILSGSHKTRDNRCSIASVKLEQSLSYSNFFFYLPDWGAHQAFIHSLNHNGWETHTRIECPEIPPLESLTGSSEEKAAAIVTQLKALPAERKALILKNSHTGGHKFAGNCIVSSFAYHHLSAPNNNP